MTLTVTEAGQDIPVQELESPTGDVEIVDVAEDTQASRLSSTVRWIIAGFLVADVVLGGAVINQHHNGQETSYTQVGSVSNP